MNNSPEQLPVGTRIRFINDLTAPATGDHPAHLYARKDDNGTVTGHDCWEGHMVKWDNWNASFGAKLGEDFVILPTRMHLVERISNG